MKSWGGYYTSNSGSVFVRENQDGTISMNMDTVWTNGHTCSWSGSGKVVKDKFQLIPDKEELALPKDEQCKPAITRKGNKLSIEDPEKTGGCHGRCGIRGSFEDEFELQK